MARLKPYRPTPRDVAWARDLVRVLKDGGVVQTSVGRYRIDKVRKRFTLEHPPDPWDNPVLLAMHHRHTYVWGEVGYEVWPKIDFDNDPVFELPNTPRPEDRQ